MTDRSPKPCEWCGTTFTPKRVDQRTCSATCRKKHNNREQNAKRLVTHPTSPCPTCGVDVTPTRADHKGYCSGRCYRQSRYVRRDRWHTKVCPVCMSQFTSKRSDAKYCSRSCFLVEGYDSIAATARAREWAEVNPDKVRATKRAYRIRRAHALLASPGVSTADWVRLLNRFSHRCAYCGDSPEVLHMDHVVPLAKGGRHSIGNVLPACPDCNLTKNATYLYEWKLRRAGRGSRTRGESARC